MVNENFDIVLNSDQGLAFVEALTGLEPDGQGGNRAKSPHARTALATILGLVNVPFAGDILAWVGGNKEVQGYPGKLRRFVVYLRAVASSLEKLLPAEDRAPGAPHA